MNMAFNRRQKTQGSERRDYISGAKAFLTWIVNPVSEHGAAQNFRMIYAMAGPNFRQMVEEMRCHPEGRRVLTDRPDLCRALNDFPSLRKLPEGSMGRQYCDFMSGPEIIPGYVLGGLAYKDGAFDRLNWPEDTKWLVERVGNTHDLTHMLSGYGSDFPGEALNINFSMGLYAGSQGYSAARLAAEGFAIVSGLAIQPVCGQKMWRHYMREAYERGAASSRKIPFHCVYLEELLPLPLEEVRERLGVPPAENPSMLNNGTAGWATTYLARQMANGFGAMNGAMERIRHTKVMVEAGIPVKAIMSASPKDADRARELFYQGAGKDTVLRTLGA